MKKLLLITALALTSGAAVAQAAEDYPPCSATRQDQCMQTPRARSARTHHAKAHRQQTAMRHRHHKGQASAERQREQQASR